MPRLREIASLINAGSNPDEILDRVVSIVCQEPPWLRSGIMAVNFDSGFSELVARHDPDAQTSSSLPVRWRLDTSPSLKVVRTRQPQIIPDAQYCPEFPGYQEDSRLRGYRTVVVLPLGCTDLQNREVVLAVHAPDQIEVSCEQLDFLLTVAHLAAISIERAKLVHSERLLRTRLERALELRTGLMQRVLAGADLDSTIGLVQTILPEPMLVIDLVEDRVFANRSPDPSRMTDQVWKSFVSGPASLAIRSLLQADGGHADGWFRKIRLHEAGLCFEGHAIVETLHVDRQLIGGLVLFPVGEGPRDIDRLQIQEARLALSVCLMRASIEAQCKADSTDRFLQDILNSREMDPLRVSEAGARLGINLSRPCQMIAVRGETPQTDARNALRRALRHISPDFVVAQHLGVAVAIIPEKKQLDPASSRPSTRQFLAVLGWELGIDPLVALSAPFQGATAIASAYRECLRILSLGGMFRRNGLLCQEHFGSFALLLSAVEDTAVKSFLKNTLTPLIDYDRDHNADFLPTISAYIDSGCKLQASSDVLGIHVSTLRYRLKRFQDQFGLNIEDPEVRFALSLAMRLHAAGNMTVPGSSET